MMNFKNFTLNLFPSEPEVISVKYIKRLIPTLILPAFKIGIFFEKFFISCSSFFEKPVVPITTFRNFDAILKTSKVHFWYCKIYNQICFLKSIFCIRAWFQTINFFFDRFYLAPFYPLIETLIFFIY